MSLGPWQIVLIVAIVLIFFGPKRIPGLGKSLGEAIRGFRKGVKEDLDSDDENSPSEPEKLGTQSSQASQSQSQPESTSSTAYQEEKSEEKK